MMDFVNHVKSAPMMDFVINVILYASRCVRKKDGLLLSLH